MSLRGIAAAVLAAGALAVGGGSFAFSQNAGAPEQPRSDQHPRKTAATERDPSTVQIKPTISAAVVELGRLEKREQRDGDRLRAAVLFGRSRTIATQQGQI
jgi:hypothetical protein